MTVLITLLVAGTDTGPFDLYSDVDGYVSAFETGVSKAALLAGYSSSLVPNAATIIRVKSTGVCTNYTDISIITTTTTTTTGIPTTTTTTTQQFVTLTLYATQAGITYDLDFHYSTNGGLTWNFVGAPFNSSSCDFITSFSVVKNSSLTIRMGSNTDINVSYPSNRDTVTCPSFDNGTANCNWSVLTNINRTFYHTANVEDSGACP